MKANCRAKNPIRLPHKISPNILHFLLTLTTVLSFQAARADTLITGVNDTNVAWERSEDRPKIFEDMHQSGVKLVRIALVPPFKETIDAIEQAQSTGLSVLLNINFNFHPYYNPGLTGRPVHKITDWPLSQLNPDEFQRQIEAVWREMETRHITLTAVEVGNEFNIAGYNADLPLPETSPSESNRPLLTRGHPLEKSLDKYLTALKIVRNIIDHSAYRGKTQLLAGAFAIAPPKDEQENYPSYMSPKKAIFLLRRRGIDKYIDGFSLHFYPSGLDSDKWSAEGTAIEACKSTGRPCWITEWGIPLKDACNTTSNDRSAAFKAVMSSLRAYAKDGVVAAAIYYDWNTSTQDYSIWRCGHLTKDASVVLNAK